MARLFFLMSIWLGVNFITWAQLPLVVVLKRPPASVGPSSGATRPVAKPAVRSKAPWIVYSDRANNPTYQRADRSTRFKEMRFRQAFYVLAERDGFLKLAAYDFKLKVGTFYARRLLKSRKMATFFGWAPKTHLLLTSQAAPDSASALPMLYCPALAHGQVLLRPTTFLRHDSLRLFAQPDLLGPISRLLKLYDLAYVYKFSESGEQALLGTADWLSADSAATKLLGWAPRAAVQPVGTGLVWEADTLATASRPPLYNLSANVLLHKPDSLLTTPKAFAAVPWANERGRMPILHTLAKADGPLVWQLGILSPLLAANNSVLNVNGKTISAQQSAGWRDRARRYNIVFALEDSPGMLPFWDELVGTIQATTGQLQDSTGRQIFRMGAVLYHEARPPSRTAPRANRITTQPLTSDFARVLDRLSQHKPTAQAEAPLGLYQPVRAGIEKACGLLTNHAGENNLIVLVGISGDAREMAQLNSVRNGLRASEARILSFQLTAPADTVANNFVLQSQQLVMQAALESGWAKRERLASPSLVIPTPVYSLRLGAQNIYSLAFPARSMVPGWVLFPAKRRKLPTSLLLAATDSMLTQLRFDAHQTQVALDKAFAAMLPLRSWLHPQLKLRLLAQHEAPVPTMSAALFALRAYPFYSQAYLGAETTGGHQLRFVTPETYDELGHWLTQLAADQPAGQHRNERQLVAQRFRRLARHVSRTLPDTVTLATVLSKLMGLPVRHPLLTQLHLRELASSRLDDSTLAQLRALLHERLALYRRLPALAGSRFTSNGHTFYWLSEELFH